MHEEIKVEETKSEEVIHEEVHKEEKKKCCGKCEKGKMCGKCKMTTKKAIAIALLIVVVALGYYYRGFFIAATVNGSPISRFDVMRDAEKQNGKTVLENLIMKKIIQDEAVKRKIRVTKDDISAEIAKVEAQLKTHNVTLEQALARQGMTRAALEEQIMIQKQVEKMVTKAVVTEKEVDEYITANKIPLSKGTDATVRAEIKKQIGQDAFSKAAQALVTDLKAKASIKYLIQY